MNLQAQMTGQLSGQVPNQPGFSLPGVPQHGESSVSTHMQNPAAQRNMQLTEKARKFMIIKIHAFLAQRLQHAHEMPPPKRLLDIARRLEQLLYNNAASKEGYMNLATLENRLQVLIQRIPMSNQQQQFSHANSSSSVGTMIPTPGMTQTGTVSLTGTGNGSVVNQMITGNGSNNNVAATINSGSFSQSSSGLPVGVYSGSFNSSDGPLANGYQQPASKFSVSSAGSNIMTSLGGQRMASQMIPTPGFTNVNSDSMNSTINSQSYMRVEPSNTVGTFSVTDSIMASQPMQQKQLVGGQNSRILHNLGSRMGGGIRSGLQTKSYTSSNDGSGMMAHTVNGPNTSDGYLSGAIYGNSSKSLQQSFDHNQRTLSQGFEDGNMSSSGSG